MLRTDRQAERDAERQTDRQYVMMKLIVVLRTFVHPPYKPVTETIHCAVLSETAVNAAAVRLLVHSVRQ